MGKQTANNAEIVLGTRASPLAMVQAEYVKAALETAHPGLAVRIEAIKTKGDKVLDRALQEIGGKGLFTQEIEAGLFDGRFDIAVHSLKDVETQQPDGLMLLAYPEREDPRDALIAPAGTNGLDDIPHGATIGTASLRRGAQARRARPDLKVEILRGTVQTRLRKVEDGVVAASFLAISGMKRAGLADKAAAILETDVMLPAPGQGILALQGRVDDERVRELASALNHAPTEYAALAERAALAALDGDCRTPIAAHATISEGMVFLRAELLEPDGSESWQATGTAPVNDAAALGAALGADIKAKAGRA